MSCGRLLMLRISTNSSSELAGPRVDTSFTTTVDEAAGTISSAAAELTAIGEAANANTAAPIRRRRMSKPFYWDEFFLQTTVVCPLWRFLPTVSCNTPDNRSVA
jgi:hypothetical protein